MADTKNTVVRFDEQTFNKLKYILWHENKGKSQNAFINEAVANEIEEWEKTNSHPITDKKLKEARIK